VILIKKARNSTIDFVKFFAIVGVVCIHTRPFENVSTFNINLSLIYFIIDTLSRFAVPFFFITSGYLFGIKILSDPKSKHYFLKYIFRIVKLYFSWMIFYFIFNIIKEYINSVTLNTPFTFEFIATPFYVLVCKIIYFGYGSYHLWYLPAIIWSITILFLFIKLNISKVLLILSFALNIIGLFGDSYKGIISLPIPTRNAIFFGLFYCTLGYFFSSNGSILLNKFLKLNKPILVSGLIMIIILQFIERRVLLDYCNGKMADNFFITTILLLTILFTIVTRYSCLFEKNILTKIGGKSLGIFVIHPFFLTVISEILKRVGIGETSLIFSLVLTPSVIITSYVGYDILQKSKVALKKQLMFKN
jgi:surface polysaccharide O-acyltransferase-like enzyme